MRNLLLTVLISFFFSTIVLGQLPPPGNCGGGTPTLASTCADACVLCTGFNGLTFANSSTDLGVAPPGFCAPALHNTQWVGFVAGTSSISIDIFVSNCGQPGSGADGDGLQIGIYGTNDCQNYQLVSNCEEYIPPNTTATFNASGLVPGGIYFVVVDGYNGDICDFDVNVTSGLAEAPPVTGTPSIDGPSNTCPGGTFTYDVSGVSGASNYEWTVNGTIVSYQQIASITVPDNGSTSFELCVTPTNPCYTGNQVCETIQIDDIAQLYEQGEICEGEVYMTMGHSFTTPSPPGGYHQFTFLSPEGCLQQMNLTLEVHPATETFLVEEICFGEVVTVGNVDFNYSGNFDIALTGSNGCDSLVHLDLTVHQDQYIYEQETICEGNYYEVTGTDPLNGFTSYLIYDAGEYNYEFIDPATGCPIHHFLALSVSSITFEPTEIDAVICPGEFYMVDFQHFYDEEGTYSVTTQNYAGCDSFIILNLSINDPVDSIAANVCYGETYMVGNQNFGTTGIHDVLLTSYLGCDSTVVLDLNVEAENLTTLVETICEGDSYMLGDSLYAQANIYQHDYISSTGCDSTVILDLSVIPTIQTTLIETVCFGETYTVGTSTFNASGTYMETLTAASGCDSVVTLNLTVRNEILTNLQEDICAGENFTVGTQSFNTTGMHQVILTSVTGCDSTVNLDLNVHDLYVETLNISICEGDSYDFEGTSYTTSDTVSVVHSDQFGCDSTINLNLYVIPSVSTTLNINICTGITYEVGSSSYGIAGSYVDTLQQTATGCDSIVYLELGVMDVLTNPITIDICEGESYTVGSSTYTETGYYEDPFITDIGCDSLVQLTLNVHPVYDDLLEITICEGEEYLVGTNSYTNTGFYTNTFPTIHGCDSVVNLDLTVLAPIITPLDITICDGESVDVGSSTYTTQGSFSETLVAASGCDSIVNLDLTVLPNPNELLDITLCEGDSFIAAGVSYDVAGTYFDTIQASNGCDSTIELRLTLLENPFTPLDVQICEGETYNVGSSTYNSTGTYRDTLVASTGCDSIVELALYVAPVYDQSIAVSICESGSYTVGSSVYTLAGNYIDTLTSSEGCDSIIRLELSITDFYEITVNQEICEGESYTLSTTDYSATGIYQEQFIATDGCDSIVILNLLVNPIPVTNISEVICDGDSVSIGGVAYYTTGMHQEIRSAHTGCDSIINLDLLVNPVYPDVQISATLCEGENYQVGNSFYGTTGMHITPLQTVNGCDSIVTLDLTIINNDSTFLVEQICGGDIYSVGSSQYTTSGLYQDMLTSTLTGCDSFVYLDLTVIAPVIVNLTEEVCQGDAFTVGNSTYTSTGMYQDMFTAMSTGCDSIVNLNLTVNPVYDITLDEIICDDEFYTVGSFDFNSTGTFEVPLETESGCDSLVTLNLITHPCQLALIMEEDPPTCAGDFNGMIRFRMTQGTPPYSYSWTHTTNGTNGNGVIENNDITTIINSLAAGTYMIDITDFYEVTYQVSISITEPDPLIGDLSPWSSGGYNISCPESTDGNISASAVGGTPPYTFRWSNGASSDYVENLGIGDYDVTITDIMGCTTVETVTLNAPQPLAVVLDPKGPPCYGDLSGSLVIEQVDGGVPPYLYSLDGEPYSAASAFNSLETGDHYISIQDANGCTVREDFYLEEAQELLLDLGPDIFIKMGESVDIELQTSYIVDTLIWDVIDTSFTCVNPTCSVGFARPFETSTYTVTAIDANGCNSTSSVTVFVDRTKEIHVPSGFSPNDDGINDYLEIFTEGNVKMINSFRVFNRWGELVHEAYNFEPGSAEGRWDGTHRGSSLNPAVFVYMVEAEFIDNEVLIFSGDVTLMK